MAEPHVVAALKDKRAELAGIIADLEKRISGHRAWLVHLDATLRMFAPDTEAAGIRPKAVRRRNAWFGKGEVRPPGLRHPAHGGPADDVARDRRGADGFPVRHPQHRRKRQRARGGGEEEVLAFGPAAHGGLRQIHRPI